MEMPFDNAAQRLDSTGAQHQLQIELKNEPLAFAFCILGFWLLGPCRRYAASASYLLAAKQTSDSSLSIFGILVSSIELLDKSKYLK
jgi:hypothetical protein